MIEASLKAMLYSPVEQGHFVQFYACAEPRLSANIAVFLGQGLKNGEAIIVLSSWVRWIEFEYAMAEDDVDVSAAVHEGRAQFVDAAELLDRIFCDGGLSYELFEQELGDALGRLRGDGRPVRVFGDAVGLLWAQGRKDEAELLEIYWNRLRNASPFTLLCGYPIDVFSEEFEIGNVDNVLCGHTQLVPSFDEFRTENALRRAMQRVLGDRAEGLRKLMKANYRPSWANLPRVEASILWLRNNLPDLAEAILEKARADSA